jgi:tRNA G18 (ribose-2'-O)-methylase SpoU
MQSMVMRKLKNSELNRPSVKEFKSLIKMPIVIVLDNIRSLNNIGSIFRTGDAFRIEGIHLCGITGTPPHREIQKTALGATESLDWTYFNKIIDSIKFLKQQHYKIIAVEQMDSSIDLRDFTPGSSEKLALVFGNEIKGISDEILNFVNVGIEIPQFGTKHSFNVSVSAGIVLWHIFNQM